MTTISGAASLFPEFLSVFCFMGSFVRNQGRWKEQDAHSRTVCIVGNVTIRSTQRHVLSAFEASRRVYDNSVRVRSIQNFHPCAYTTRRRAGCPRLGIGRIDPALTIAATLPLRRS